MQPHPVSSLARKRRFVRRLRWYGYGTLCMLLLIAAFAGVRALPRLHISRVDVSGADGAQQRFIRDAAQAQVARTLLAYVLGSDHYLAWPVSFADLNPNGARVSVEKNIAEQTITLAVSRPNKFGVWCAAGDISGEREPDVPRGSACWWFDDARGVLIEPAIMPEGQLIPAISETQAQPFALGDVVLEPAQFNRLKVIFAVLGTLDISVARTVFTRSLAEAAFTTAGGASVRFSLRFDPLNSLAALKEILKQHPLSTVASLNFTVENKAYLTLK